MRPGLQKTSGAKAALALLLPITLLALALDYSFHRAAPNTSAVGIEQPLAHKHHGARVRADIHPSPALSKVADAPALPPSVFFLRVDLKQDLTTWPVLSNYIERSPPFFIAS
jgi:hypothetical protein